MREERMGDRAPRGVRGPRPDGEQSSQREIRPDRRAPRESGVRESAAPRERGVSTPPVSTEPVAALDASAKPGAPKQSEQASQRARALAARLGVSVVVPLYNEQGSLRELTAAIRAQLVRLCAGRYQIIFVNDGSTDRSADILRDILQMSSRITVLSFRRNMGKSAALAVGFREVKYGIVITMDADLQDDPAEIPNLIGRLDEGFDLITGWKKKRHDPISKTLPSKFFNRVTSFFSGLKLHDFNCGLKAYRKEVVDSLNIYGEMHRYLPALAHWKGFRVGELPVVHHPRKFGKSKFGSSRFFKGFLDLLTIVFTNRYGKRPLHLFGTIGTLLAILGFGIEAWVSVEWAMGLTSLSNRPVLLLGALLMLVGAQLISLGLLGEMIVKSTNSSSDFVAIRELGRRLPEDREAERKRRESRRGEPRDGRRESSGRRHPDERREERRRDGEERRGEERRNDDSGEDRGDAGGPPRRMGRDRRRRPR